MTSDFLNGAPFNVADSLSISGLPSYLQYHLENYNNNQTSFVRLENNQCVETYTAPIISNNSDLLLVTSDLHATSSLLNCVINSDSQLINNVSSQQYNVDEMPNIFISLLLLGHGDANLQNLSFNTSEMLSTSNHVNGTIPELSFIDYCLSKRVGEHCKLQFSVPIMIVVIICNMIKTVCMTMISWKQYPEPLVTLGDAIVSFLDRPDVITKRNCMAGKTRFEKSRYWGLLLSKWDPKRFRWFRAASRTRWIVCNML